MLRGQLIEYKKRKHIVTIMSDLKSAKKADLKLKKADLKLKDFPEACNVKRGSSAVEVAAGFAVLCGPETFGLHAQQQR